MMHSMPKLWADGLKALAREVQVNEAAEGLDAAPPDKLQNVTKLADVTARVPVRSELTFTL